MKVIKVHILLAIVLLGNAALMRGMLSKGKHVRYQTRPVITQPMQTQPIQYNIPAQKPTTATWKEWFQSLFSTQQRKPVEMYTQEVTTSPFESGGRRSYSSRPQQESWWSKLQLALNLRDLTPEEYSKKVDNLLEGHKVERWTAPNGRVFFNMHIFDTNDLDRAMKEINQPAREYIMNRFEYWYQSWSFLWTLKENQRKIDGTVLDKVLCLIFNGDFGHFNTSDGFTPSDNTLNYLKLAYYLSNNGAIINPENEEKYVEIYVKYLMEEYKALYKPQPPNRYGAEYELQKFKEIFKELDPLLEKIISKKDLKEKLYKAQKERQEIEVYEQQFRKKLQDEADRDEFLWAKAKYEEISYLHKHGFASEVYTSQFYERLKKEPFNEVEYQAWLKSGKNAGFFHGEHWEWDPSSFSFKKSSRGKVQELKNKFQLPENASDAMILQRAESYIRQEHPDILKSRTDITQEEKDRRAKEFGEFMGHYDDTIKELKKRERQEKQSRE